MNYISYNTKFKDDCKIFLSSLKILLNDPSVNLSDKLNDNTQNINIVNLRYFTRFQQLLRAS